MLRGRSPIAALASPAICVELRGARSSRAPRTGVPSCSAISIGAFQNAMMQSPIYLSMVPVVEEDDGHRGEEAIDEPGQTLRVVFSPSAIVVKPRISQNLKVIPRASPPSSRKLRGSATSHHLRRQIAPKLLRIVALLRLGLEIFAQERGQGIGHVSTTIEG